MRTLTGIRRDVTLKISALIIVLILGFLYAADQFILDSFQDLEHTSALNEIRQIRNVVLEEQTTLKKTLKNEAQWDAAYAFVGNSSPAFIASDMLALNDLGIDFVLYLDRDGNLVYGKQLDPERIVEEPISPQMAEDLVANRASWDNLGPGDHLEGLVRIGSQEAIIASQPILTSAGEGPSRGTLVIGHWVDTNWLGHLGQTITYPLKINRSLDDRATSQPLHVDVSKVDPDSLVGRIILNDISGQPLLALEASLPRNIFSIGQKSVFYFAVWFIASILVCGVLIHFYINKWINSRIESRKRIQHLAYHDRLTDLPNRLFLEEFVQRALHHTTRAKENAALLFIDIDRFTQINDIYGHATADTLLVSISRWLVSSLRESDLVSRISGDMFAIFLPAMNNKDAVKKVAGKILDINNQPFDLNGNQVYISCSLGISLFPEDGQDFHSLLKLADMALHEAKRIGRNNYRFASKEMNSRIEEKNYLEAAILKALNSDEFHLAYQPQYDMGAKRLKGVEALLRWTHPERGDISPGVFIPIAEKTGLIHQLGEWVIHAACKQISEWRQTSDDVPTVAVNFSGLEIKSGDFTEKLEQALRKHDIPAEQVEIEITESTLMDSVQEMHVILNKLREKGFRIAIDDFGTGYSSLSYLRNFPIQKIKIDKSFTSSAPSNRKDVAIIDAIMTIANSLDLEVIAEGVETAEQLDTLLAAGCHGMQGFFFARPMPGIKVPGYCPFKINPYLKSVGKESLQDDNEPLTS